MGRKTIMNSITTDTLLSQVCAENRTLLSDFLDYLRSIQRSENTISGYKNDIEIAWAWCLQFNGNLPYYQWTKRHIIRYQKWLIEANHNSPARIRRLRSSLSSLSNYIECVLDDEYPNYVNIIKKIEAPVNSPVREKTILEDEDIKKLLTTLIEEEEFQAACFFALAAYSGRRKAELCRFRVDDFSDDKLICNGGLWKSAPIKTKGRGGGKYLPCYTLARKFRPYLKIWLQEREERKCESKLLFVGRDNNQPLTPAIIERWTRMAEKILGKNIYVHSFRHYFTTMLSKEGIPDSVIQRAQGWADISMVSVYLDSAIDDTLEQYFGENGIKKVEKKGLADIL